MARLKIAPQRGHAAALAEIMARQAGHDVILVMALPRASLFVQSISLAPISIRAAGVTLRDFAIRTGAFRPSAVGLRLIRAEHHQPSWFALG